MADNVIARLQRSVQAAQKAFRTSSSIAAAERQIDDMIARGEMPSSILPNVEPETKVGSEHPASKLDVRTHSSNLAYAGAYDFLARWIKLKKEQVPAHGDPARDYYLTRLWQEEPIMAGAVYSMTAKMTATKWNVIGRRLAAKKAATIFAQAAHFDGYDWGGFIASTGNDFYTTNRGVFWETPREGDSLFGNLSGIGHIDALLCTLTGNKRLPMVYVSDTTGQSVNFRTGEYIHFTSLPSPREQDLGHGFCAVDRAFRAINLLIGLHDYDEEKLSNLPPEGVAAVTGLTMSEFQDALSLWRASREKDKSFTFPQVLWLLGSQPNVEVKVDFSGFSQIPESFDRQSVITHYVSTLALCFGVDPREFWPISSGALGTASESEIQHLKAKGKGPGEFISTIERHLNGELPEDVQFGFDTQDIEEDSNAAMVAKAWIDAYYPLYTGTPAGKSKASPFGKPNTEMVPNAQEIGTESAAGQAMSAQGPLGQPGGVEQVITKDQLLRLLADKGVIPEWMMNDERVYVSDTSIHIQKGEEGDDNDLAQYQWDKGVLKEIRPKPLELYSGASDEPIMSNNGYHMEVEKAMLFLIQKEQEILDNERKIRGKPIPSNEVDRGARITAATIRSEIERWRKDPLLSKYVEGVEEELTILQQGA